MLVKTRNGKVIYKYLPINLITKTLNQYYENRWFYCDGDDITDGINYHTNSGKVMIIFPEIEIKNEIGHSHLIRNLLVYIDFTSHDLILNGYRTLLSYKESSRNYYHSHLKFCECCFSNFCPGGPLYQSYRVLVEDFSEENLCLFLDMLNNYLSWESISGGPYIFMENIIYDKVSIVPTKVVDFDVDYTENGYMLKNVKGLSATRPSLNYGFYLKPVEVEITNIHCKEITVGPMVIQSGIISEDITEVGSIVEEMIEIKDKNIINWIEKKLNKVIYAIKN